MTNGYRSLAAYLATHIAPNDVVLLDGISQWFQYWYYAELRDGIQQRIEFMPIDVNGHGADGTPVSVEKTEAKLKELASSASGIWYLDSDALRYDPRLDAEQLLNKNWYVAGAHTFVFQRAVYYGVTAAGPLQDQHAQMDGFELVQASAPSQPVAASRPVGVTFVWRATRDAPPAFKESLRLVGPTGAIVAQEDGQPQGGFFKTSSWKNGVTIQDNHGLVVPIGTPPGVYKMQLVAYDPSSARPLGPTVDLGSVTIDHGQRQPAVPDGLPPVGATITTERLLAGDFVSTPVGAGNRLGMTLLWSGSRTSVPASINISLGTQQFTHVVGGSYPTTEWQTDDVVRDTFDLRIPASLAPGIYPLSIDGFPLGRVQVTAGDHVFTTPSVPHALQTVFGNVGQLVGYDAQLQSGKLHLRLFWNVLRETDLSYTAFVHILGPDGKIHGQVDAPPGTNNWVTGEYVATTYDIPTDLDAAQAQLEVGLYDSATGKRLPTCSTAGCQSPDDHVIIPLK